MSKYNDLMILLRGLEHVGKALAAKQQTDLGRVWHNSSVKSAAKEVGRRLEQRWSAKMSSTGTVQVR